MKEIKLSLRLTLSEYDTLVECVADELHRSEVFAGDGSALAATCSSLLDKIKDARLASATCADCLYCEPCLRLQLEHNNKDLAMCLSHPEKHLAYLSAPACSSFTPDIFEK